jgi:hypothetical protein
MEAGFHFVPEGRAIVARRFIAGLAIHRSVREGRMQDSILLEKAGGFRIVSVILMVGTSIEGEHNNQMLGENERIVRAAVSERTFLCRMHMTRS